ncbi:hypothetical protein GCM10011335_00210 [Aureimonas glaciei]|uniref:Uncharacterized protein n=1 Tax=Aureimonas glaciei TaxID=1776957 RepID=A0A916XSC6_9HYPH|nr:hypothetical protein GCM10011335_00210 [Aureimonas glaciei]
MVAAVAVTGGGGAGGGGSWLDDTWPVGAGRSGAGPLSAIGETERVQPEAARTATRTAHVFIVRIITWSFPDAGSAALIGRQRSWR